MEHIWFVSIRKTSHYRLIIQKVKTLRLVYLEFSLCILSPLFCSSFYHFIFILFFLPLKLNFGVKIFKWIHGSYNMDNLGSTMIWANHLRLTRTCITRSQGGWLITILRSLMLLVILKLWLFVQAYLRIRFNIIIELPWRR